MDLLRMKEIDVEVLVWNEKAVNFYGRLGYKKIPGV
jgi:hypothetical protein